MRRVGCPWQCPWTRALDIGGSPELPTAHQTPAHACTREHITHVHTCAHMINFTLLGSSQVLFRMTCECDGAECCCPCCGQTRYIRTYTFIVIISYSCCCCYNNVCFNLYVPLPISIEYIILRPLCTLMATLYKLVMVDLTCGHICTVRLTFYMQ